MATFLSDLRRAARTLAKSPGYTIVCVVILCVGIAINTAAFSAVNVLIRRPLPFPSAERIAMLGEVNQQGFQSVPYPVFRLWREQARSFEAIGGAEPQAFNFKGSGEPESIRGARVTAGFLRVLGLKPMLGRGILSEEEQPGRNRVALISEKLWAARFASDPAIIGREMVLNGEPHVVIGVVPRINRSYYASWGIWTPAVPDAKRSLQVIGLLNPAATFTQAEAEMNTIQRHVAEVHAASRGMKAAVFPMANTMKHVVPMYMVLLTAVGLVLLILCANIASLQLARAASRQKEVAVRLALGASRLRVVCTMLSEGLLLAAISGSLAVLLTVWVRQLLIAAVPELKEITVDAAVLCFTLFITVIAGVMSGLSPALSVSRPDINAVLKSTGRQGSPGGRRLQRVLVICEMALAVVLLAGTGLLTRAFLSLHNADPGFRTENLLALSVSMDGRKARPVLDEIGAVPGVESVAGVSAVPLSGGGGSAAVEIEGRAARDGGDRLASQYTVATPRYFGTMRIPLRRGRDFTDLDRENAPGVAIVNERAARALWPKEDPLGARIRLNGGEWRSIVGIVADARQDLINPTLPQFYVPHAQDPAAGVSLVVRTSGDPASLVPAIRRAVRRADPNLPVASALSMREIVAGYFPVALVVGISGFCTVALFLAALGLYGIVSYLVTQRTREIGIRMALGADARDVLKSVVRQGLRLACIGAAIGLAGALALTRLLQGLLFGVNPTDPVVFGGVVLVLTAVALAACYFPARRAARLSPIVALRYE